MSEELKIEEAKPLTDERVVVPFPIHRISRLQNLSDDQLTRLIWLLNQTEALDQLLNRDLPKLKQGCSIARALLKD